MQTDPDMLEARSIAGNQFGISSARGSSGPCVLWLCGGITSSEFGIRCTLAPNVDDRQADRAHVAVAVGDQIIRLIPPRDPLQRIAFPRRSAPRSRSRHAVPAGFAARSRPGRRCDRPVSSHASNSPEFPDRSYAGRNNRARLDWRRRQEMVPRRRDVLFGTQPARPRSTTSRQKVARRSP